MPGFCKKIGKNRSKISRIRENYVQNSQKTMLRIWQTGNVKFDKSVLVC